MPRRLLAHDASVVPLTRPSPPGTEITAGSPEAHWEPLDEDSTMTVGVWPMTEGTAGDTEGDEIFVVLAGSGTLTFEDGEQIELGPATVVRLRAGERTTWHVTEPLRKLFVSAG